MNPSQNVLKMSTVTEPWHKQRDGGDTDWWLQHQSNGPAFWIRL